ncbi:hypothetical protein Droror1_Dr00002373 [Drosera rotundifolia]
MVARDGGGFELMVVESFERLCPGTGMAGSGFSFFALFLVALERSSSVFVSEESTSSVEAFLLVDLVGGDFDFVVIRCISVSMVRRIIREYLFNKPLQEDFNSSLLLFLFGRKAWAFLG